jgi:hypothetical protein
VGRLEVEAGRGKMTRAFAEMINATNQVEFIYQTCPIYQPARHSTAHMAKCTKELAPCWRDKNRQAG